MSKSSEQFFKDLLAKIPKETSILVEKQMDIAVAIGDAIKNAGMTKKEFAKKIGLKESYVSRVCAGNVNLTLKTIAKFEAALDEIFIQVPMFAEQQTNVEVFFHFKQDEQDKVVVKTQDVGNYGVENNISIIPQLANC